MDEATHNDAIVQIRDLTKSFRMGEVDVPVLRGIDLDIPRGRLTVLLGPSGSGKTTLLNLIGGLDSPTTGTITFEDQDLAGYSQRERTAYRRDHIGFIFQFYNLIPTLTAMENVHVTRELVNDSMDAREALELVDLGDRLDYFPAQLSGGQQQRVAIARALVKEPSLLLCDEPTGALDRDTGRHVLGVLRRIADEMNKTIIIVTHNSAIAGVADRIVRLGDGVIDSLDDQPEPMPVEEIVW